MPAGHAFPPRALGTGGFRWATTPRLDLCTFRRTRLVVFQVFRELEGQCLKPMGWGRRLKPRRSGVALEAAGFNMLRMLLSLAASSSRSTLLSKSLAGC